LAGFCFHDNLIFASLDPGKFSLLSPKIMTLDRRKLLKQFGVGIAATSLVRPRTSASIAEAAPNGPAPVEKHGTIRLDRNENAYGTSRKAIAAIQANQVNRYPDTKLLQDALAAHHNSARKSDVPRLKPEHIVPGCGSSELLRMAASAFLSPGKKLILAVPTCDLPATYARKRGATVEEIPLRKDHAHDLDAMLKRSNRSGASGLIYLCNPNSPTGSLTPRQNLEDFLAKVPPNFHVLLDEAYNDYAGGSGAYVSFIDRPVENPRVIVTRTFSTSYGLAGARVGYGVTSSAVAAKLSAESLPFATNRIGISAAIAALADQQHIEQCAKRNFDDRQEFMNQVNARMLRALDSHANFVCLNLMRPSGEILQHYQKNGFVLSPSIPTMPNYLRISLGSPEEMMEFWRVWDLLGSHPMSM
jgi:histidinol-phosphate aminotransferase